MAEVKYDRMMYDKILGSLACAGMGDALGAATELYSIDEIRQTWGGWLDKFVEPPIDTFAGSLKGVAGLITDDSSQMYVFSEALIAAGYGQFTNDDWKAALLRWADMMPYAMYKGPTTEQVVKALREGHPTNTIGRIGHSSRQAPNVGTTNGAGMRVAPAGLVYPGQMEKACHLALLTCLPSHDTNIAIASACAIAGATSQAMVINTTLDEIIDASLEGARQGEQLAKQHARCVAGPSIEKRIRLAVQIAREADSLESCLYDIEGYVGNSVAAHESIPAAIGLLTFCKGKPWETIVAASNVGNDTDSIATMAGAIAGAWKGFDALPKDKYDFFNAVNSHDFNLPEIAAGLTQLASASFER
ncbi:MULTISPECIES: ADP-ribosylglycohydrolase family protein [unclassified Leclercia]|uniref:ADP-ribosylglycohydrolase family protein n=1 Tax=Leclercia barmai TaxID=2785629 RepID=A0ABS7RZU1_9ENTR|nr:MULTISPECIES: ADP-ribosylglycohydrolase family protein [unclassified Leclercia]MBZ0058984.1 ADP-ribosylglycohydrolase family protein [Leclercia sp. EMC7]MCM5697020.1 ADP-ribosylglycohydrolase family protein [Leclercia sp. LTM01]MCM5701150.1 ADP-ribosylglycohydrolase family protein [Leclercia sp. LTM14]